MKPTKRIKIVIVGDQFVGKSNILYQYCDKKFSPKSEGTIGLDFKIKKILIGGEVYYIELWDTAGQERFRTICDSYYKGASGFIATFDLTENKSYQNIHNVWIKNILTYGRQNAVSILIGNKSDSIINDLKINEDIRISANEYSKESGIKYFETSAKTGENIEDAFTYLIGAIIKKQYHLSTSNSISVHKDKLTLTNTQSRKLCCS